MSDIEQAPAVRTRDPGGPTVETLNTRLTALEDFVFDEVEPRLAAFDRFKNKNDEMYEAFLYAKNGIRVMAKFGNGVVKVGEGVVRGAEWTASKAKTFLILAVISGAAWTFLRTGKLPDWFISMAKAML